MSKLVWHQMGEIQFESGVDRGVFYDSNNIGHVWNGLTNVEESSVGGENNPLHFDGVKQMDRISPRNYSATISAFAVPRVFGPAVGDDEIMPGFVLTRQTRSRFGLSYRTMVGRPDSYKIHLVYNILATPANSGYTSIDSSADIDTFSWKINAVPPPSKYYRPTAHYILGSDTMPPDLFALIEDILYGTDTSEPRLPSVDELRDLVSSAWSPYIIVEQPLTGLSELVYGDGDVYSTWQHGINRAMPETTLTPSEIPGLYRLE